MKYTCSACGKRGHNARGCAYAFRRNQARKAVKSTQLSKHMSSESKSLSVIKFRLDNIEKMLQLSMKRAFKKHR